MIQFCDRNAEDVPSFFEGQDQVEDNPSRSRARWALERSAARGATLGAQELMDPIRLLEEPGIAPGSSGQSKTHASDKSTSAPPPRVWDSIESALRDEGLIR